MSLYRPVNLKLYVTFADRAVYAGSAVQAKSSPCLRMLAHFSRARAGTRLPGRRATGWCRTPDRNAHWRCRSASGLAGSQLSLGQPPSWRLWSFRGAGAAKFAYRAPATLHPFRKALKELQPTWPARPPPDRPPRGVTAAPIPGPAHRRAGSLCGGFHPVFPCVAAASTARDASYLSAGMPAILTSCRRNIRGRWNKRFRMSSASRPAEALQALRRRGVPLVRARPPA